MKYQKPVNNINSNDEFSSALMESYGRWMGGDTFQNTTISEAPFDGMDPQSNGAEIEDTTKRKKTAKKGGYIGQESAPKNEEYEVLETEEYEIDGETYVIEKVKGLDGKACWKGYKYAGTKMKGSKKVDDCVKAGFEPEGGEDLQEKAPPGAKAERMVKHIKKSYAKDGKLTDDEKSIAYATAWKAKNKTKKESYDVDTANQLWSEVGEKLEKLGEMDGTKFKVIGEKLDPVGKEDKDIDNDGDHDKSDKYLHARRKKIGKILAMKKKS
jgi:hypothetical protein